MGSHKKKREALWAKRSRGEARGGCVMQGYGGDRANIVCMSAVVRVCVCVCWRKEKRENKKERKREREV